MRAYSPGGALHALATPLTGFSRPTASAHRLRLGLEGYLIPFAPLALVPQCQSVAKQHGPAGRLRHRCSSRDLRISPLHREFPLPLPHSSQPVSTAAPGLSPGIERWTWAATYGPFTPNHSGQRLHPPYYRGCWHGVSRCLFLRYRQNFFSEKRSLRPTGLHPPRGIAPSGFRPLRKIPHCCLP